MELHFGTREGRGANQANAQQGHARGHATTPGIFGGVSCSSLAAWLRAGDDR